MDEVKLKEYLKNNLRIEIVEYTEATDVTTCSRVIEASLYLENELISTSKDSRIL